MKVLKLIFLIGLCTCGAQKLNIKNSGEVKPAIIERQISNSAAKVIVPSDVELFSGTSGTGTRYSIQSLMGGRVAENELAIEKKAIQFGLKQGLIFAISGGTALSGAPSLTLVPDSPAPFAWEGRIDAHPLNSASSPWQTHRVYGTFYEDVALDPEDDIKGGMQISEPMIKDSGEGGLQNLLGEPGEKNPGEEWVVFRRIARNGGTLVGGNGTIYLTLRKYKAKGVVEVAGVPYGIIEYLTYNIIVQMLAGKKQDIWNSEVITSTAYFAQTTGTLAIDQKTRKITEIGEKVRFNTHIGGNVANPVFFLGQSDIAATIRQKNHNFDLAKAFNAGGMNGLSAIAGVFAMNSAYSTIKDLVVLYRDILPEQVPALCEYGLNNSNYPKYYKNPIHFEALLAAKETR